MDDSLTARPGDWIVLYGSLMRGLGAMDRLGAGAALRFVGPCRCRGELYDLGDWPGMRHGEAHVIGELFAIIDPEVVPRLDAFEDFRPDALSTSTYLRERIELLEPLGAAAWIYVYNQVPDARSRIASGDWRAHLAARPDPGTAPR